MSLTIPQTMLTKGVKSQSFELQRLDYLSPENNGRVLAVAGAWPLWTTEVTVNNLMPANSALWRAWIAAQRGAQRQFYGFDIDGQIPLAYRAGGTYTHNAASWTVNTTRDVLTLNGLAPGQIISATDYIGFSWSTTKRAMVRAVETVTANGSGVAVVTIEPAVHVLVPGTAIATVHQPNCLMRLTAATIGEQDIGYTVSGTKISAVQDLVA